MSRTKIDVEELSLNGVTDYPAGTTIDAGLVSAGAYIDLEEVMANQLLLIVANAEEASDLDITISAGDKPPSFLAGQGDIEHEVGAESSVVLGPFDGQLITQDDHTLLIDFEAGFTGTICALKVPRHA